MESPIRTAAQLPPSGIPGIDHLTLACRDAGDRVSVWRQRIEAGQATPVHSHPCDEVVTVQRGAGELRIGAATTRFAAGDTLVLPAAVNHQIVNCGAEPLELLAVFPDSPVTTYAADGSTLQLPWKS
jgi:quercetin dioxygenase-like cupin family protein